jgi:small-conductance mechanosensitive channel
MTTNILESVYFSRLISSLSSIITIIVCAFVSFYLIKSKSGNRNIKNIHKLKHRISYITFIIILLVMIRIWVDGFAHIFAMISVIAAGLVVTNKDSIMNITGWLIINWRGLFSEGDFIQIQNIAGHVECIRLLHFKIYEVSNLTDIEATGRTIKIPNSLVITNPITIFSSKANVCLNEIAITVTANKNITKKIIFAEDNIIKILDAKYNGKDIFHDINQQNKNLDNIIHHKPMLYLKPLADKENMLQIVAKFYCVASDAQGIKTEYLKLLTEYVDA